MSADEAGPEASPLEDRVLILAPTANDATLTANFLRREDMAADSCRDIPDLCAEIERGCGALLLAEETLVGAALSGLVNALGHQPAWSDLPITIITGGGEVSQARLRRLGVFGRGGNVTLLERPFRPATLVSTVEVALRARRRQHEVRELLKKLSASEERMRGILEGISDAFVAIDRGWRFTYVNSSFINMVSPIFESAEDLLGRNVWERFPDIADAPIGRFYRQMMDADTPGTFEVHYPPLEAWFEIRAFPSASGLSLYIRNITNRKRHEVEVAELSRRIHDQSRIFDATLSNIVDLVYSFDRQGRVIYANKAALEVWGKTLAEVVGRTLFDLPYPDGLAAKIHDQLLEVIGTKRPIHGETVYRGAAGADDIHDYIFNPVLDEQGEVTAVVGTTRLVTQHRKAEGAMRQLAAIVQSSDDAIISKDRQGVITSWNVGAERLFGYTAEEIVGRSVMLLIPPDREDEEPGIVSQVFRGEPISHYETLRRHKDGRHVEVSLSVSPIRNAAGEIIGASKIVRDISDQKRTEQALKEAKEAAEAANRSKDHFLAVLSHELRTPLTPVLMTASALEMDHTVPPALRADMAMIRRNVELETKLIDDLLDLSRITSGKLSLHVRVIDPNEAVRQVCAICEPEIAEKGVRLAVDLDEKAGHVRVDPARLQQMLWNVLKNAAKFTPAGGHIRVATAREAGGRVRIAVQDSGIGVAPEVLPKIFDAFEQGDAQITRQFGGLGLGLAITKALVELHDGTIRVDSPGRGQGSKFTIDLPASTVERDAVASDPVETRKNDSLRILVVEDHPDTAMMLARLLGLSGYAVTVANTANAGLELAEKQSFDVVVSDIGLPDLTGYEFMRKLLAIRPIRGIAMSGYGMEDDIRRSLEAGFREHLVKPVSMSSLEQAIRRLASQEP